MVNVRWTGAAGLRFDYKGGTFLIDPYYTRVNKVKMAVGRIHPDLSAIKKNSDSFEDVSAIVVSHTHFDHVLDVPVIANEFDCELVGSKCLDTLMAIHEMPGRTTICHGGETVRVDSDISVTMIKSEHGLVVFGRVPFQGEISPLSKLPMKANEYRVGTVFVPKIEIDTKVFMHIGSANYSEHELSGHGCDVLFLCVAGWNKIKGYPERIIDLTNPSTVVLFHFDDFFKTHGKGRKTKRLSFLDMEGLKTRIHTHAPEINLIVPEVNDIMSF